MSNEVENNPQINSGFFFWANDTQRNLIESNRNQIIFTIFRLILKQTNILLVPNQSENSKYNLILVWFNKISRKILCENEVENNSQIKNWSFFLANHTPTLPCFVAWLKVRLHWDFLVRALWLENSYRLLIKLVSWPIGNQNFAVSVFARRVLKVSISAIMAASRLPRFVTSLARFVVLVRWGTKSYKNIIISGG